MCLAVYLGVANFHFTSVDEVVSYTITRNLVGRGAVDADAIAWLTPLMDRSSVVAVAPDGPYGLPPGTYQIVVGLYDGSLQRLPLENVATDALMIGEIELSSR